VAKKPEKLFCAAPWLESVLYNDGAYRICSRNSRSFADWREEPIEDVWRSEGLRAFRRAVAAGEYPDDECASCHAAGTYQSLRRILTTPLNNSLRYLVLNYLITYEEFLYLQRVQDLFEPDFPEADSKLAEYEHQIKGLLFRFRLEGHGEHLSKLKKIQNIVWIIKAMRSGDEAPPVVAPFRQVQLIAKCNARCVMCPGRFTGEIESGGEIDPLELEKAMAKPGDIVDFFCNGSEFLLFKGWKEVAQQLKAGGVASLRLSTNGMLLTAPTAEYLVDHQVIGHLNVSLNAGSRETLERVQKNVRWERLIRNVDHLLAYAEKKKVYFPLSFSFIVMRSNFHELPLFLERVAAWKRACKTLVPHAMVMSLENAGEKDYRYFLYEEHPSFAPQAELRAAFTEAARIAEREKIEVELYNFGACQNLRDFVSGNFPFPEFVPHVKADHANIAAAVRADLESIAPSASAGEIEARIPELGAAVFSRLFARFPEYEQYRARIAGEWVTNKLAPLRGDAP
jgi:MoaA/NifB/PqqE/SkfB family radical SAM enzyme